jgi:putative transposase
MNNYTPHIITEKFIDRDFSGLSLAEQAELLGISRTSLYYTPLPADPETLDLMKRIDKIHTEIPFYGARKIAKQVRLDIKSEAERALKERLPLPLLYYPGRQRVGTLMETMAIEAIYPKPNLSQNNSPHPIYPYLLKGLAIMKPNQVWGADITYIPLHGGFCYLVVFLDWYSRFVVGWKLSTTLQTEFVLDAALEAIGRYGFPLIINVDQGVQFTDGLFISLWEPKSTRISMDHRGRCFDNIFTERFWRTLKYYEVYLKDYQTVWDAEKQIGDFIKFYNNRYLHQALDYKIPGNIYLSN